MYPALILVIVNKERSIVNMFGFTGSTVVGNIESHPTSTEHHPATIGHLIFANPPTKSTVDNEQSLSPTHSAFFGGHRSSD